MARLSCPVIRDAYLSLVCKLYDSDPSSAGVDIQSSDNLDDCSNDVDLEVSVPEVGCRVDNKYDVGPLSTDIVRFCHKFY